MRIPTYCLAISALMATAAVLYGHTPAATPHGTAPVSAASQPAPSRTPVGEVAELAPALAPAFAAASAGDDAPYYAEGQYTARLDQTHNLWRLQPIDGPDRVIDAGACSTGATVPGGVWLLVLDGDGRAELVAPSATPLASGAPPSIGLRGCDEATGDELAAPQAVIDLLVARTGAIRVDR